MKITYIKQLFVFFSLLLANLTYGQYDEMQQTIGGSNFPIITNPNPINRNTQPTRRTVVIDIPFLRISSKKITDFPSDGIRLTKPLNLQANGCLLGNSGLDVSGGGFSICSTPGTNRPSTQPGFPAPDIGPQPIGPCGLIPCNEERPEDRRAREEQERRNREIRERIEREREEERIREEIRRMDQASGLTSIRNAYDGVRFANIEEAIGFHVGARTGILIEDLSKDVITETLSSIDIKRNQIDNLNTQLIGINTSSSTFANIQNQKREIFFDIRNDYKLIDGIIEYNRVDQTSSELRRALANEQLNYFSRGFEVIRQQPIFVGPSNIGFREVTVFLESPEAIGGRINHSLENNNPRDAFFPTTVENKNRLRDEVRPLGGFPVEANEDVDYSIILAEALIKTREGELVALLSGNDEELNQEIIHSQQFSDWLIDSKNDILNYLNINNNS